MRWKIFRTRYLEDAELAVVGRERIMERPAADDADEIIPGVWISRWQPAHNADWLRKHKIQTVFNCTKNIEFHPIVPYQYRIPVDDNLQPVEIKNMTDWAPEIAFKILREYKAGHPLLIHCHAGMQRSTTACAFFLLVLTGWPLIQVMRLIRDKRPIAFRPTPNFASALRDFEAQVTQQIRPVQLSLNSS
jgi:protein-tyrosine phosphatase